MLWWLFDVILIIVVFPVVVLLLHGVLAPAVEIRSTARALSRAAPALLTDLDQLGEIVETERLVREATAGLAGYATALKHTERGF
jgi:hypothetical protein